MKHTGVYHVGMSPVGEAFGYSYTNGAVQRAVNWDMSKVPAAGDLYSTAHDLYLWNEAIFNHRVLSQTRSRSGF